MPFAHGQIEGAIQRRTSLGDLERRIGQTVVLAPCAAWRRPASHPALATMSLRTPSATVATRTRTAHAPRSYRTRRSATAEPRAAAEAPTLIRAHVVRAAPPTWVKLQK